MVSEVSNAEFARRIGVSPSMASRVRSGQRLPGARTIWQIHREFAIPLPDLMRAREGGPDEFGRLLREHLVGDISRLAAAA